MSRDQDASLARGHRLGRVQRVDAGVSPDPRAPPPPLRSVRVCAVLEQEDPAVAAVIGDPVGLEGDVPADVHEPGGLRTLAFRLRLEVGE